MKKIFFIFTLTAVILCVACKKDKENKSANSGIYDNTKKELAVSDIDFTECLNSIDSDKEKPADWDSVYIDYSKNSMKVNIHNFGVLCSIDYVEVSSYISNDTIYVEFDPMYEHLGPGCSCDIDVSCMVTNIPSNPYNIVVCGGPAYVKDYLFQERHNF